MEVDKKEKKMRAIIYCRVSTKEQANEGLSLYNQEKTCKDFAKNKNFILDKVFIEEGESAKTQLRPKLIELLSYSRENKGKIDVLIVWKVDRFSRQTSDHFAIKATLAKYGVKLCSVTEPIDETPQGKLMETVLSGFAEFDNNIRTERTIIGMRDRVNEGRWVWQAPLGYLNSKDINEEPLLIKDREQANIISRVFKEFSKGLYSQVNITEKANEWGLKSRKGKSVSKQTMSKILNNPVYTGFISNPWTGELIKGLHEPIIKKGIFDTCKAVLGGKKPSIAPRLRNNPEFPLRGFIKCKDCGKSMTGSNSRGRSKYYSYYHCYHCGSQKNLPKKELHKKFLKLLDKIKPSEKYLKLFKEIIIDVWGKKYKELNADRLKLQKELGKLEEKKEKIINLRVDGKLENEEYDLILEKVKQEILIKEITINETKIEEYDIEGLLNYAENFISNSSKIWKDAELDQKQRFQQLIFPKGLVCNKDGFIGTPVLSPIYAIFEASAGKKSIMVTPRGFEPLLPG